MRMSERVLLDNAGKGRVPVFKLNERVLRFHPRTILASRG